MSMIAPGSSSSRRVVLCISAQLWFANSWLAGSVSARASKYSWLDEGRDLSGCFQHTQNRCGAAKEVEPAVVGGDVLIGSGSGNGESSAIRRRRDRTRGHLN